MADAPVCRPTGTVAAAQQVVVFLAKFQELTHAPIVGTALGEAAGVVAVSPLVIDQCAEAAGRDAANAPRDALGPGIGESRRAVVRGWPANGGVAVVAFVFEQQAKPFGHAESLAIGANVVAVRAAAIEQQANAEQRGPLAEALRPIVIVAGNVHQQANAEHGAALAVGFA